MLGRLSGPQDARFTTGPNPEARRYLAVAAVTAVLVAALAVLVGTGQFTGDSRLRGADSWVLSSTAEGTFIVHVFAADNEGAAKLNLSKLTGGELAGAEVGVDTNTDVVVSADTPAQIARIDPAGRSRDSFPVRKFGGDGVSVVGDSEGAFVINSEGGDTSTIHLVDPADPDRPPAGRDALASRLEEDEYEGPLRFVFLRDRSFWFYDVARGEAFTVGSGLDGPTSIADPGTDASLFGVDGVPVALVLDDEPHLRFLGGSRNGDELQLPDGFGSGAISTPVTDVDGDRVWLADGSGRVVAIPVGGGETIRARLSTSGGPGASGGVAARGPSSVAFGPVYVLGEFTYIADPAQGVLWKIPAKGGDAVPIAVPAPSGQFQITIRDGYLWVNDPAGDTLLVIDENGNDRLVTKIGENTTELDPEELEDEVVQYDKPANPTQTTVVEEAPPPEEAPREEPAPRRAVAPSPPRSVVASPGGPASIQVTCGSPADDGGAAVTRYQFTAGGPGGELRGEAGNCAFTFTGLDLGTYSVAAIACNSVGCSPAQAASAPVNVTDSGTNPPTDVHVANADAKSYTVTWQWQPTKPGRGANFVVNGPGCGSAPGPPITCVPGGPLVVPGGSVTVEAQEEGRNPATSAPAPETAFIDGVPQCTVNVPPSDGPTWSYTIEGSNGEYADGQLGACGGGEGPIPCTTRTAQATYTTPKGQVWGPEPVNAPCPDPTTTTQPAPTPAAASALSDVLPPSLGAVGLALLTRRRNTRRSIS